VTAIHASAAANSPQGLLLDMDGTLVQSEHMWGEAERAVMADLGVDWSDSDRAHVLGGPLERVVAYMIGKSEGEHDHDDVGLRLLSHVEAQFRTEALQWTDGMVALLNECSERHIPAALVTASTRRLAAIVVDEIDHQLGRPVFHSVITADDVDRSKPAPDPYLLAAQRLMLAPDVCLAIEDSRTGLLSAQRAGCRVIEVEHLRPLVSGRASIVNALWRDAAERAELTSLANHDGHP
jgi:HAD superfamily hydrolase (TIGR01509 family)